MTDLPPPERPTRFARLRLIAPVVLAGALFALGIAVLYHLLSGTNPREVLRLARAEPARDLVLAGLAAAAGYGALILYDRIALMHLGLRPPARAVALGGFLGNAFGNTLGLSVVSGGAIRYRIYAAFGLRVPDVAALSVLVALATGFGVAMTGLIGLAIEPTALAHLTATAPGTLRGLALAVLAAMGLGLGWLSARHAAIGWRGVEIAALPPRLMSALVLVALADTGFAALTLWLLLPADAPSLASLLPIIAVAFLAGVASHVPGGVGVFEAVMIAAMPPAVSTAATVSALLLFRALYYFLPFALALLLVAVNEARLAGGLAARLLGEVTAPMRPVVRAVGASIPALTGTASLAAGIYLVLVALMPVVRPHAVDPRHLTGAILLEGGAALSAMIGVVLVMLSQALLRRIAGSFWLLQAGLVGGAVASALNDLDLRSALLLGGLAALLSPFRRQFARSARITRDLLSPAWCLLMLGIALGLLGFFFFMHKSTPWSGSLWTEFTTRSATPRSLRAGLLASALLVVAMVWLALRPVHAHARAPDGPALARARAIVNRHGTPDAVLALSGDKALFFSEAEDAFIAYAVQGRSWIALGDPVGPPEALRDLAWAFFDAAWASGARPAFYSVSDRHLSLWVEIGFTLHKLGEEARVTLPGFSLAGSAFKTMRAAQNKALKSGLSLAVLAPPHGAALLAELAEVSRAWLDGKAGAEKGFSVGRFTPAFLDEGPLATVRLEGRLLAFATLLAPGDGGDVAVDLMRYRPDAPRGLMEFVFVSLIEHFRDAGARSFSLGVAPLSGLRIRPGARAWARFGALIYRHGGAFYNFEGLRAFKQKFHPDWQPRYLAVYGGTSPLLVLKDSAVLIAGGMRGIVGKGRG